MCNYVATYICRLRSVNLYIQMFMSLMLQTMGLSVASKYMAIRSGSIALGAVVGRYRAGAPIAPSGLLASGMAIYNYK